MYKASKGSAKDVLADGEAVAILDNEDRRVWLESSSTIVIGSPLLGNQSETLMGSGGLGSRTFPDQRKQCSYSTRCRFVLRSTGTS